MTPALRDLEVVRRHAPFGVRFRDLAGLDPIDGLDVVVFRRRRPHLRSRALANASGVYCAHGLAGLATFEFGDAAPGVSSPSPQGACRVEVSDPRGRFLPLAFDADLPARGLFVWGAPGLSPPSGVTLPTGSGSPPATLLVDVPLFSTPSRLVPDPLAVVYAQLVESGTSNPCAWTLLQVTSGNDAGIGLSDRDGRVAVIFPHPAPPRPTLSSPPAPRNDFRWPIELTAYRAPPTSPAPLRAPDVPDLADVLAQLQFPRDVLDASASPPVPLGPQQLEFRVPLTVRTPSAPAGLESYLFVSSA